MLSLLLIAAAGPLLYGGLRPAPPEAAPLPSTTYSLDPADPAVAAALDPSVAGPAADASGSADPSGSAAGTSGSPAGGWSPSSAEAQHIYIPSIGVAAAYEPVAPDRGTLEPPYWPQTVGLNSAGGTIAGAEGTVLFISHVNYVGRGQGAFASLSRLQPLSDVYVTDAAGALTRWRIVKLVDSLKSDGIDQSIFDSAGPRRIVLVTCGGVAHNGNYDRNVLAYGVPVTPL